MLPKKTLFKKKLWRAFESGRMTVRIPERFVTPKDRPGVTPEQAEKAFMDILDRITAQHLRESGNRTGRKRKRLIRRIKWMQGII